MLRYRGIEVLRCLPVPVHVVNVGGVGGLGLVVTGAVLLQVSSAGELLDLFCELL